MKDIRFGIIGCGLMGREFASAAARWCHLVDPAARPVLTAVCDYVPAATAWFTANFPTVRQATSDYQALLANPDVDAVYVAVPHNLHAEVYCAVIEAGKHLMGEKPFGIDKAANEKINAAIAKHPGVFVRCVSQFPFFPAVQRIGRMLDDQAFGRIIEVNSGFLHSSDLDADKPINWKRKVEINGAYGAMGDLGMHACHVPLRAGFRPRKTSAVLSNIVTQRWADKSRTRKVPCETWDNATILIEAQAGQGGYTFPWMLRTYRIAPGQTNTWYIEIFGDKCSARWNSCNPKILELLEYQSGGGAGGASGGDQTWRQIQTGYEATYPTITGGIFEFGFTDAILQMWAAYVSELVGQPKPGLMSTCVKPEEVAVSHDIFTAALQG
jgi:predicted dehydrogenase